MKKSFIKKRFNKLLKQKEEQREVSNDEVYTVGIIASGEIYKWMKIENEVEQK